MKDLPQRKEIRLEGYDYSENGAYFVTICVKGRHEMLGSVVGGGVLDAPRIELSALGKIVADRIDEMNGIYQHVSVDKYIVMPNHVHLILFIENPGRSRTPAPTSANATIPAFISTLKRFTNQQYGQNFWQRSYHDHIIRNDAEYRQIWPCIDTNPLRWEEDIYYTSYT